MDKIYRRASQVNVWLGIDNEETKNVLTILREIAHRIHDHNDHDKPFDAWLSQLSMRIDRAAVITQAYLMQETAFSSEQWKLLGRFYNANWFRRIWVIQEIRESSEGWVLCGKFEVKWAIVALAATWISLAVPWRGGIDWKKNYFGSYMGFRNAKFMWDQTFTTCREAPFLALLHRARAFQSTDARDKVFSMLNHRISRRDIDLHQPHVDGNVQNLVQSSVSPPYLWSVHDLLIVLKKGLELQADYTLSKRDVYRQVAIQSLQRYNNAEVLCYAWQTSHHDVSWPSWIPRWDIYLFEENEMVIIPLLYDASQHSSLDFRLSLDYNILFLRGINLGTIVNTSTNLEYQMFGTQDRSPGQYTVEDQLQAMAMMITQDRWQDEPFDENSATRTQHHVQARFAGFSAYILPLLKHQREDCFISLGVAIWCDFCEEYFHPRRSQASSTPSEFYHCYICKGGSSDICLACYNKGMRCKVPSHILKRWTVGTLSIPYTDSILRILEAHAPTGDRDRFQDLIKITCRGLTFFSVSQGWHGTASGATEPGDVVAILFGSRVPFILRKHNSGYRLVSNCYVQGLMDGEAMAMLKNGELESEIFEIH